MLFSQPMDQKLDDGDLFIFYGDGDGDDAIRIIKPCIHLIQEKNGDSLNSSSSMKEQLPKKYKLLSKLFDSMLRSMLLLGYEKRLPIYRNICIHVKLHIRRQFSYRDLAQIKSVLPEAVQTEKILLKDHENLMEPHLKVTLRFDVVTGHTECCDTVALSREFDSRLFKLVDTHGEDYDVPEAELPDPFNTRRIRVSPMNFSVDSSKNEQLDNHQVRYRRFSTYRRHFQMEVREFERMDFSPSSVLGGEISSASSFCAKVCDVPKPELPNLYNERKTTVSPNLLPVDSSRKELQSIDEAELPNAFQIRPPCVKQFLAKDEESAKNELSSSLVLPSSLESDTTVDKETGFSTCADQTEHENSFHVSNGGTLMKNSFILAQKNVEFSILSIPRRSVGTEHNKLNSICSQSAMKSGLLEKRFLDLSITDDEGVSLDGENTFATSPPSKVCDVPKPELLRLDNKRKTTVSPNLLPVDSSRKELPNVDEAELLNASHIRPSCVKQLPAKDEESAKIEVLLSSLESDATVDKETGFSTCADQTDHGNSFQVSNGGTLMKNSFKLVEKNVVTSPRRSVGTEHSKVNSMRSQNAMKSGLLAKRFSDFSITDDEGVLLEGETTFAAGPSKHQQGLELKSIPEIIEKLT